MKQSGLILGIDQGTTSSRAILFDDTFRPLAESRRALAQIYPQAGWVEHDAGLIFEHVLAVCRDVLQQAGSQSGAPVQPVAIGITNQRETTVLWERASGRALHNAIVWQDRRTASYCAELRGRGLTEMVRQKTGLELDPYFSASKINWLLAHTPDWRRRAEAGELCAGTIDAWLIYRLTGGRVFATDATNASRTLLYNIHSGAWDDELLALFDIPRMLLPEIKNCQDDFGHTDPELTGMNCPIRGVAGDQQAALVGQACIRPGMVKATYGTGCFAMMNTGQLPVQSENRLLTTLAWQIDGVRCYALEGAVYMAGAVLQWLRDNLGILEDVADSAALAAAADPASGVVLVPAFQGLGAPYWDAAARASISGLSRAAGRAEIVRAALESVAFQTRDLMAAMVQDAGDRLPAPRRLRVDGGMTANDWLMQCLADQLDMVVELAPTAEATALGAALHAAAAAGMVDGLAAGGQRWQAAGCYEPMMPAGERQARYEGWQQAVARLRAGA